MYYRFRETHGIEALIFQAFLLKKATLILTKHL